MSADEDPIVDLVEEAISRFLWYVDRGLTEDFSCWMAAQDIAEGMKEMGVYLTCDCLDSAPEGKTC